MTAWKALSHANAKEKGINSEGWVGNQVFSLAEEEKKKRSEIYRRDLQKTFWGIKYHKFPADD